MGNVRLFEELVLQGDSMSKKINFISAKMALFSISFVVGALYSSTASPHLIYGNYGYIYFQRSVKFQNQGTRYATAISNASLGYGSTRLLTSYVSGYSGSGVINYYEASRGANFPMARTIPWSGSTIPCGDLTTGNLTLKCNTTTQKVTHAQIYLNSDYGSTISSYADFVMKHEAGHVFGMSHGPCDEVSVMMEGPLNCPGYPTYGSLQPHDISLINSLY